MRTVISAGLVFLAILAGRVLKSVVPRQQWMAVGLTALGLVLLAATLPSSPAARSPVQSATALITFEGVLVGVAALPVLCSGLGGGGRHGVLLGATAGLLFGAGDIALKILTANVGQVGAAALVSPWSLTFACVSVFAFFAFARGLQEGDAVAVITFTTAAVNIAAIGGGVLVLGDPVPAEPAAVALSASGFALVIAAASLTSPPAPVRRCPA